MTLRACGSTGSGGGDRAALVRDEGQEDEDGAVGSGSTHARARPAWCDTGGTTLAQGYWLAAVAAQALGMAAGQAAGAATATATERTPVSERHASGSDSNLGLCAEGSRAADKWR